MGRLPDAPAAAALLASGAHHPPQEDAMTTLDAAPAGTAGTETPEPPHASNPDEVAGRVAEPPK